MGVDFATRAVHHAPHLGGALHSHQIIIGLADPLMPETIPTPAVASQRVAFLQPRLGQHPRAATRPAAGQQRHDLMDQAAAHEAQAKQAAERGDIDESARCILLALDCERRAGGIGPQVLQVIKPRA